MKRWIIKEWSKSKPSKLAEELNVRPELLTVMKNRGIDNLQRAELYLNPSLGFLRNPFLLKGMTEAVERINRAIANKERICIYGDYDVDGVSATSILLLYFESIGYEVDFYIPNRLKEGYGLSIEAIEKIEERGCDLIMTVDCGITSVREAEYVNMLGMDIIITDHHECQEMIPEALAVINPKQPDCNYPFSEFCGCGLALKLIQALTPEDKFLDNIHRYLEIATIATVCDMVPLIDENRIIVKNGLEMMKNPKNMGVKALMEVCGIEDKRIGSSHIGYAMGPRINASGRLGFGDLGVKLFLSKDPLSAFNYANELEEKNNSRQEIEMSIYQAVENRLIEDPTYADDKVLVIASEGWQHGIIGIVASKLMEKYYKPVILFNIEDGVATGSARSIKGFNIFEALMEVKDLMLKFGGHSQAAGMSLVEENLPELRRRINEAADYALEELDLVERVKVELEAPEGCASVGFVNELHKLEPYGIGNPTPYFLFRGMRVKSKFYMGKLKNHIRITVEGHQTHECVGFNMSHLVDDIREGDYIDLVFQIDKNTYRGETRPQLLIKDIKLNKPANIGTDEEAAERAYESVLGVKDADMNTSLMNLAEGKDAYDIEMLSNLREKRLLMVAGSYEGYYRMKADLNVLPHKYIVDYDEYLSKKDYYDKNDELIVFVFARNIDKLCYKSYNYIIVYDYVYAEVGADDLFENSEIIIIKRTTQRSLKDMEIFMDEMDSGRDKFTEFYRLLFKRRTLKIKYTDIYGQTGLKPIELFSVVEVLSQGGLISYDVDRADKSVEINLLERPENKVDLEETEFKRTLRALREGLK